MPAFSQGLEKALHQALTLANERETISLILRSVIERPELDHC